MLLGASTFALPPSRIYIAPHGPKPTVSDPSVVLAAESSLRHLWAYTRSISELGATMFARYPRYEPLSGSSSTQPVIDANTMALSEMPKISAPSDEWAMNARLRIVMEDPRQLLSGCMADYAVEQLVQVGNEPGLVVVPGLDGVDYKGGFAAV